MCRWENMKGRRADPRPLHKVCTNVSGFANPTNEDLPPCQARPFSVRLSSPGDKDEMRPSMAFSCISVVYDGMLVGKQV